MRRSDWVAQLWKVISEADGQRFAYGKWDCVLFAAGCIDSITGSDHSSEVKNLYRDKRSALRYLMKSGGIRGAVTARLGEAKGILCASRGDVVEIETDDGPGLGICVGEKIAALNEDGIEYLPLTRGLCCWRII